MIKTIHEENYDALLWYAMHTIKGHDKLPTHVRGAVTSMMPKLDKELPLVEASKQAYRKEKNMSKSKDNTSEKLDTITLSKGTVVHREGIPFELMYSVIVQSHKRNFIAAGLRMDSKYIG